MFQNSFTFSIVELPWIVKDCLRKLRCKSVESEARFKMMDMFTDHGRRQVEVVGALRKLPLFHYVNVKIFMLVNLSIKHSWLINNKQKVSLSIIRVNYILMANR